MKKLLMTVLLLTLLVSFSFAQWEVVKQRSNDIGMDNGFFIDANTGWSIGDYANDGAVWKTTDGGENWTEVRAADESGIQWRDIEFFDADTGYACADDGYIFKTVDGGATWTMIADTSNYKVDFAGLSVVTADLVYFSGDDCILLKTTDGGASYTAQGDNTVFLDQDLDGGIAFANDTVGVVISDSKSAHTWYTKDGGTNWNYVNIVSVFPVAVTSNKLFDVSTDGNSTFVIVGNNHCKFISTNGGESYILSGDYGTSGSDKSVDVIDANTIFVGGTAGLIVKTLDGGATWDTLKVGSGQTVDFVDFIDANTGYIFSSYNQWFKTEDGGTNFTRLVEWPSTSFRALALPDYNKIVTSAWGG